MQTNVWKFEYNANGWRTRVLDPTNHANGFGYDNVGNLTSWTNPLTSVVNYYYNALYRLTNIVDARLNALGFTYQDCCATRLKTINYGTGDLEQFNYDPVGNLTNYVNRAGQAVNYAYDAANRVTNKVYSSASDVFNYLFDQANQLTNATWMASTATNSSLALTYDVVGRIKTELQTVVTGATQTVTYDYFDDGSRRRLTYPDGTFVTNQYNAKGWLTNVADGATGGSIVNYQYDLAGNRTYRGLGNGTYSQYQYDAAGRLTSLVNYKPGGTVLSSYAYGYDNAGNRKWMKRSSTKGDVYTYDADDQITSVIYDATTPDGTPSAGTNQTRYVIDEAGNWTSRVQIYPTLATTNTAAYQVSRLNQYTNIGGITQFYDTNGNFWSDGTNTYYYDYENRLNKSLMFGTTGLTYTNVYDAFGRWVARKRGTLWTFYYYAGWQLIEERDRNNVQMAKYVYGAGLDEPVRAYKGTAYYYYHTDGLGSITEVTDVSGNLVEQYNYDIYGKPTIRDNAGNVLAASTFTNRWLFTGRDWDADQLIYNYRFRWYSPILGRFLQTDPIGVNGGINVYQFVGNDPINSFDSFGLREDMPGAPAFCNPELEQRRTQIVLQIRNAPRVETDPGMEAFLTFMDEGGTDAAMMMIPGPEEIIILKTLAKWGKPALSAVKNALRRVHDRLGKLPKGQPGKWGSPQRGTPEKGYRLDPGHPDRPAGDPETGPHINWWDWTKGKKGKGGEHGAEPIK
jgi:RHS repeat-associated protein